MANMKKEDVKTETDIIRFLSDYSDFERDVYVATFRIPKGKVSTYKLVAEMIGRPKACRAVANALHNNPLFPVVPCWRVVKSDGGFGGEKRAAAGRCELVRKDGVRITEGKVAMSGDLIFAEKLRKHC